MTNDKVSETLFDISIISIMKIAIAHIPGSRVVKRKCQPSNLNTF